MAIISVSLPAELLAELRRAQTDLEGAGQSELVRRGLQLLLSEHRGHTLKGRVTAMLVAAHPETAEAVITQEKHAHEDVVRTHIHHKSGRKCLEIFVLEGPAQRVREFTDALERSKRLEYVKLLVA